MRRKRVIAGLCVVLVLGCSGLLLTAVQRVREAAALARCTVVKQLALSVHSYADIHDRWMPSGPVPLPGIPPERRLSWIVETLPYTEAHPTYELFDLWAPADSERNRAAAATYRYYGHLVCPMSPVYASRGPDGPVLPPVPITNRIGSAGVGTDAAELPGKHPRAGAFGHDRRTRYNSEGFPDGLETTFLILETGHEPGHWAFGGPATVRPLVPETAPYIGPGRPFGGFHARREFSPSPHGGIMVAAMADGSIKYIRGDIDPGVLEALATVNGREPIPADW